MLAALVVLLRSLRLLCSGHRAVALENLARRQQLAVFRRSVRRPQLHPRDRLFWVLLAKAWRDWRTALIVVRPDTVVHASRFAASVPILAGAEFLRSIAGRAVSVLRGELLV